MSVAHVIKALIPIAKKEHSSLPLQSVFGADGTPVPLIQHLVVEFLEAGIEEICLVVNAGSPRPRFSGVGALGQPHPLCLTG